MLSFPSSGSPAFPAFDEVRLPTVRIRVTTWPALPPLIGRSLPAGGMIPCLYDFWTLFLPGVTSHLMGAIELYFYHCARQRYPIERTGNGCWEWRGACTERGYGILYRGGKKLRAHRHLYEEFVGPIPEKLVLDHLCRNKGCVNPSHLEPVTTRENILRGEGVTAQNAKKTECSKGHPFDAANTFWRPEGGRDCRKCNYEQAKRRRKRKRQKAIADVAVEE